MTSRLLAAALLLAGCRTAAPAAAPSDPAAKLRGLGERYWTTLLATGPLQALNQNGIGYLGGPIYATSLGDHRFDDHIDDLSPEAHRNLLAQLDALRGEAQGLRAEGLAPDDALSLEILRGQLDDARDAEACRIDLWIVDPQNGPQVQLGQTSLYYPLDTAKGAADLAVRDGQAGRYFGQIAANLRQGLAAGLVAPRANVQRVIEQLEAMVARGAGGSELLPAAGRFAKLGNAARPARDAVERAIADVVLPAAARLRNVLRDEVLPASRDDAHIGLWAMPGGDACYAFLARRHTATTRSAQELHWLGLEQLSRIEAEEEQVALEAGAPRGAGGRVDLAAFRAAIARQPEQFKRTEQELLEWNRALLGRAIAALPRAFNPLPLRQVETRPVEAYRAASFTVGYYQPAPDDGSQPAIYYVNTHRPETRALYNNEALLFHEAVPGHHLQGSVMQELSELPEYRRQFGPTAYIEGWALYSERMSDEALHLYSGPLARFGMLGYQAWRAARLVVDTGMHALRWDRGRALRFLIEHTTLPGQEAANEIDRYAASPGQALGYMVGELEIYRLRGEAERALGPRFDLRGFHDVVLRHGPVGMSTLARLVEEWQRKRL